MLLRKAKKAQLGDVFEPVIKPALVIIAIIVIFYIIIKVLEILK